MDVWPRTEEIGLSAKKQFNRLEKEGFQTAWVTHNEMRLVNPKTGQVARLFPEDHRRECHLYVYYPPVMATEGKIPVSIEEE